MAEDGVNEAERLEREEAEVVAFLRGRSAGCPRCGYDLRGVERAVCPECGERLVMKVGSAEMRFGWVVCAMAPGCFSGVMAVFVAVPIVGSTLAGSGLGRGLPWPIVAAEGFGIASAASVWMMYRHRRVMLGWGAKKQARAAAAVWGVHVLALACVITAMAIWY